MSKNKDLIQILIINFGLDFSDTSDILKTISTFGWFLLIFGLELIVVYIYYQLTNKIASKRLEEYKTKK